MVPRIATTVSRYVRSKRNGGMNVARSTSAQRGAARKVETIYAKPPCRTDRSACSPVYAARRAIPLLQPSTEPEPRASQKRKQIYRLLPSTGDASTESTFRPTSQRGSSARAKMRISGRASNGTVHNPNNSLTRMYVYCTVNNGTTAIGTKVLRAVDISTN